MVAFSDVEVSNSMISTTLPTKLVAVFVGATSGIGEYAMKAFAQQTTAPTIYFIGRSQDAANRIMAEIELLNPKGEYVFIKSDIALLKNVDDVCQQILAKENAINLLFQTQGTILPDSKYSPPFSSTRRFISNPTE
jgi:NADP-dependent 3-hydroxy acid dehydrogenase YdfG